MGHKNVPIFLISTLMFLGGFFTLLIIYKWKEEQMLCRGAVLVGI